jgi:hypothetical protein
MTRSRTVLLAVLAVLGLLAAACSSSGTSSSSDTTTPTGDGTEWSGTTINVPADFPTIQEAVNSASPGDLILVGSGIYKEAVDVETPGLTIRGLDRNATILDGEFTRDNGIRVLGASNVTVQNMTARNYTGNGFYWTGVTGYHGSYLTAYRNGDYGIYAFDSVRGQFDHSYASGSPDAGFYIGECFPCDAAILDVVSEYNGLGYSGTNSGGNLVIANSEFAHNRAGLVPNSGSYELCYPERDTTIVGNLVHDNGDDPNTPAIDVAKLAMGTGILPAGGRDNLILNNRVYNHERVGIGLVPFPEENPKDDIPTGDELTMPCSEARTLPRADKATLPGTLLWDAMGNTVKGNVVSGSGLADLAFGSLGTANDALGNCFEGNTFTTSAPADIETVMACTNPSGEFTGTLDLATLIATERPPSGDYKTQPVPPEQPNMPDAATAPGMPAVNVPEKIDVNSIPVPAAK